MSSGDNAQYMQYTAVAIADVPAFPFQIFLRTLEGGGFAVKYNRHVPLLSFHADLGLKT